MRTVVITGSASGIGKALKDLLHGRGDRVIGVDLSGAEVEADLAVKTGRRDMVERVTELTGGRIDAIVANAGLVSPCASTIAVNVFGAIATLEGLRPLLRHSDAPRAALTGAMACLLPADAELVDLCLAGDERGALERTAKLLEAGSGDQVFPSSKAALVRWMRRTAPSPAWAGAGIPLNAVGPGVVATPLTRGVISTEGGRKAALARAPMPTGGIMMPDVPARLLAWLVSEENTHVSGQVVYIDGGTDAIMRGDSAW
ncbi:SDR family oxidoreductase [Cellulomonas sp. KRMCY2]|uniref:SDR family oxidoreductase n=1 Tax=Cellulomonas sp. KRMCY2 TaxID=1304865 RepID=UPI0004B0497F|nr:SDR family oxidoreductase [Cellulomonas sp. KRMCY2]